MVIISSSFFIWSKVQPTFPKGKCPLHNCSLRVMTVNMKGGPFLLIPIPIPCYQIGPLSDSISLPNPGLTRAQLRHLNSFTYPIPKVVFVD